MVKFSEVKAKPKKTGIERFKDKIKVDLETGRITSANILIGKVDVEKGDTVNSIKNWILSEENEEVVATAFQKYENSCSKRKSSLKETSTKRKAMRIELKDELLREKVRKSLTKPRKPKVK